MSAVVRNYHFTKSRQTELNYQNQNAASVKMSGSNLHFTFHTQGRAE